MRCRGYGGEPGIGGNRQDCRKDSQGVLVVGCGCRLETLLAAETLLELLCCRRKKGGPGPPQRKPLRKTYDSSGNFRDRRAGRPGGYFAFCSPSDIVQVGWAFVKGDVSQHVGRGEKDRAARLWLARGCGED